MLPKFIDASHLQTANAQEASRLLVLSRQARLRGLGKSDDFSQTLVQSRYSPRPVPTPSPNAKRKNPGGQPLAGEGSDEEASNYIGNSWLLNEAGETVPLEADEVVLGELQKMGDVDRCEFALVRPCRRRPMTLEHVRRSPALEPQVRPRHDSGIKSNVAPCCAPLVLAQCPSARPGRPVSWCVVSFVLPRKLFAKTGRCRL